MLSFQGRSARLCDGLSRREWLKVGGLSAGALTLADLLQIQSANAANPLQQGAPKQSASFGKAKHCIVLFLLGGPPQHETWDPKPEAPEEVRGQFGSIETATRDCESASLCP